MEHIKCGVSLEGEEWKAVKNYEKRYLVSNLGRIYSLFKNILRRTHDSYGYTKVTLDKENKKHQFNVHRLVAEAFVFNPDPEKFTIVNHIDNDGKNNRVENCWSNFQHFIKYLKTKKLMIMEDKLLISFYGIRKILASPRSC